MQILYEEVKQYPLLCDKQMKRYREKNVVSNACQKIYDFLKMVMLLFFVLQLDQRIILSLKGIGKFVLFAHKNNQEGCTESYVYLEPKQISAMELFLRKIVNNLSLQLFSRKTFIKYILGSSKDTSDSIGTYTMKPVLKKQLTSFTLKLHIRLTYSTEF